MVSRLSNVYQCAINRVSPSDKWFWSRYSRFIKALEYSRLYAKMQADFSKRLNFGEDDIVLDAGCGRASWSIEIAPNVSRVIALDSEHRMIIEAAKNIAGQPNDISSRISLFEGSIAALPLAGGSVDIIGNKLVYGYLGDEIRQMAMEEFARVLKPGGRLGIVTLREGANVLDFFREEFRMRTEEGASLIETLSRLPLGLGGAAFGVIAQVKYKAGEWGLHTEEKLVAEVEAGGLRVLHPVEVTYGGAALTIIAEKPAQ
jgi:ubiquinone/menaquinone biosynthesis C-methylase UbiE